MPAARATAPAPLGLAVAAGLLAGVVWVQTWPRLPPWPGILLLAAAGALAWWRGGAVRMAGACVFGTALACAHGALALAERLPDALAGRALVVEGRVAGLSLQGNDATRFAFDVLAGEGEAARLAGSRLRLAWFAHPPDTPPRLEAGSRWRLTVKLRPSRGVLNPGGYDIERRALEQRLAGNGHVLDPPGHAALDRGRGLDRLRETLSQRIAVAVPGPEARFVQALALGDTRALDDRDWEILRATGLTHLIAISGFHVGLVAGFGALLARLAYRGPARLARRLPRPQGVALAALAAAAAYTALAGFALPTVRTLLMIAVLALARCLRRPQTGGDAMALALVAILLADPLSVLAPGFWLSFLGVAWLLWCLPGEPGQGLLRPFVQAQGVAMAGLLPLSVWFFHQASLPGPLVNLVGIPWISLGVVPLALLGIAFEPFSATAAALAWQAAAGLMAWLWRLLETVAAWPAALVWLPEPSLAALALALAGTFWLLLPRGLPGKPLAALMLLPLLWPSLPRPAEGEADLVLLDVGQGLSLLVLTRQHALLYDAGPAPSRGLDFGEAAVLPALRALGLRRLDRVVVSHGDNDHAGGLPAVLASMPAASVQAPEGWAGPGMQPCVAGAAWTWDGVRFEMLHPPPYFPYRRNDSSCVLRIQAAGASALLPGDIGRHVEARLARLPRERIASDVLVVPHHGSESSSSLALLAATRPRWGLLPVGHDNRFGLPKPLVLARYERYGVALLDSAGCGMVRLRLGHEGARLLHCLRRDRPRYWRHAAPDGTGYAIGGPQRQR